MLNSRLCCALSVLIILLIVEAKEKCEKCVPTNQCPFFANLTREDQNRWISRFDCTKVPTDRSGPVFGFASLAKGDMICCPGNVWSTDNSNDAAQNVNNNPKYIPNSDRNQDYYGHNNRNQYGYNKPGNDYNAGLNANSNYDSNIYNNHNSNQPKGYGNNNGSPNNRRYNSNYGDSNYGNNAYFPRPHHRHGRTRPKQINNNNPNFNGGNNNFGGYNSGGQCYVTSFPPDPNSGCCGREATDSDRIADSSYAPINRFPLTQPDWDARTDPPSSGENYWSDRPYNSNAMNNFNLFPRAKRAANVTIDNRIAGGKETELEQYPWTVLLRTVIDYGTKETAFNCGGSLISSRYVLTAAHCLVDDNGRLKEVKVFLAEYDRRTFPKDCKHVLGHGQKCVENVVMYAEDAIPHPQYDNNRLYNDIALLRLQGMAPYTDFIRPICLPPINVDDPDLFNLQLAVAGWGRNGEYKSDIKQSTVLNLVPNQECKRFYPHLSQAQLCASGYSGEDTCKGDSGGPLMMLYEGKYYVTGVVSGKRADAPCGTSVPSLYTNVYKYLQWIQNNIRN